jgi:hypothetical protein
VRVKMVRVKVVRVSELVKMLRVKPVRRKNHCSVNLGYSSLLGHYC